MRRNYQRHLPHQVPEGYPIFLTWNLKGAMPCEVIERLQCERDRLGREPERADESVQDRKIRHDKLVFAVADRHLDSTVNGPMHLSDPAAAKIVQDSIWFGVPERYKLYAWCVMANHAHVLLNPEWQLQAITQGIKGFTAHQINGLKQARGRVFWQDESYDHWARNEEEFLRIIAYIENNPVVAGLCQRPDDWLWSSARFRRTWAVGQPFQADDPKKPSGWKA